MAAFNFHRRRTRRWWYAGATLLVAAVFGVLYVAGASAIITGPPTASPSSFEANDGNMLLTTSGDTDWSCFVNTTGFAKNATTPTGCATNSNAKNVVADAVNGEISWVNGQKFDTQCPALAVNNNPPKDEFVDVASYSETASNLNVFFYGASIRSTANGNASGDVEFNQQAGNGTTSAGCRTFGDRLVAYDFLNGGTGLDLHVLTWIDNSVPGTSDKAGGNSGTCFVKTDSMPCWGAAVLHPSNSDTSVLEGQSNQGAITAANNPLNNANLAINQFAEFGVNLSAVIGTGSGCLSFPQEVWESRSSGSSFTSNPQDIEIENQQIRNCGEIKIVKATDPAGSDKSFSYTSTISGSEVSCTQTSAGSFSLNAASSATGGDTQDCTKVPQGNYTVTEGSPGAGWSLKSLTCTNDSTSGSSGAQDGTTPAQANITLKPGGLVTCTYTNQAQGEIVIIKHTNPRGLNQVFSYSSGSGTANGLGTDSTAGGVNASPCTAAGVLSGAFCLNDNGLQTTDSTANTLDRKNLATGSYNVTETLPTGWTLGSLTCSTGGAQHSTGSLQADITLTAGATVTCTYVNNAPSGAILVTKTGKYKSCTTAGTAIMVSGTQIGVCTGSGTAALGGASFKVTTDSLGANAVTGSPITTSSTTGKACIDGLFWIGTGNHYFVTETGAPGGYSIDSGAAVNVVVSANATCNATKDGLATGTSGVVSGTSSAPSFTDTPLTTLEVIATSEKAGATKSTITCTHQVSGTATAVGTPISTPVDPADWKTQHLAPDTYTCTVVIDP